MVEFGSLLNGAGGWLGSIIMTTGFWMLIALAIAVLIPVALVMRKKRLLDKVVLEMYDLGEGRFDFNVTRGGWLKHKLTLNGLWDYGNEKLFRLQDNTPVYDVSHNDYRNINGKLGLVVIRNPNDAKFVVPISKFFLSKKSYEAMAEIAPVDLRNASTSALEQVDIEMQTKWEKWAPLIAVGVIAFVLIFSILLIAQYGKHNIEQTTEILRYAVDNLKGGNYAGVPETIITSGSTAP